ncbi:MAG: hypothetical protein AAFQ99_13280, partial [Pseudomonadota bacterium]
MNCTTPWRRLVRFTSVWRSLVTDTALATPPDPEGANTLSIFRILVDTHAAKVFVSLVLGTLAGI